MSVRRSAVLALLLAALACAPEKVVYTDDEVPLASPLEAEAGDWPLGQEQDDPPTRVVRLNLADGNVTRQPQGMDEWTPAMVNLPLGTGDRLWVPPGGRAELHAGATGLRLGPGTDLDVLRLGDHALQLGLPQGALELRVGSGREADSVEVDTPVGAVLLDHPGTYRVDADPDGAAGRVTVRSGQAAVTAGGATVPVDPGTTMALAGGDSPSYDVAQATVPDAFDQWCSGREQREDRSDSVLYVGKGMTGCEDLDGQGTWQVHPVNGTVWVPRVAPGWAPFRDGRWIWCEPWGWTWVDDAPWGFAPSHYGRWVYADNAWMWMPYAEGMRMAQPVYAPAVVAFAGGPGFRGSLAAGAGVAWFPLGPREPYLPAYPASRSYVLSMNAANAPGGAAALRAAVHVNQAVPGAMTVVPQSVFLGAGPVAPAAMAVKGPIPAQGWRAGSAPALVPRRESVLAALPGAPPAGGPPQGGPARALLVRTRLPLAPVSFEARQQALAAAHGRPLAAPALAGLRAQVPAPRAIPARLATSPASGGALRPLRPAFNPGASSAPAPSERPVGPAFVGPNEAPPPRGAERPPLRPGQRGNQGQQARPGQGGMEGRPMRPGQGRNPGQQRNQGRGPRPEEMPGQDGREHPGQRKGQRRDQPRKAMPRRQGGGKHE